MMLYPSIQQLTKGKINRYELVIAAAKGARHVTQKNIDEQAKLLEKKGLERTGSKDYKAVNTPGETLKEKAVSIAIKNIADGTYKIISAE